MTVYLWMGLSAVAGALLRLGLGGWIAGRYTSAFPFGTFVVNLSGSFLLGFLVAFGGGRAWAVPQIRMALGVGLLGSYTTFSTFSVEAVQLLQQGKVAEALLYSGGSAVLGVLAAWLGMAAGRLVP